MYQQRVLGIKITSQTDLKISSRVFDISIMRLGDVKFWELSHNIVSASQPLTTLFLTLQK